MRSVMSGYIELHTHSAFTLLEGASLPEQLAQHAAFLGYPSLALTDRDDLGGQIRFLESAEKHGLRTIIGAELTLDDGAGLVLLVKNADGFANLASLIALGRTNRPRGKPYVSLEDIFARSSGLVALSAFLDGPIAPALRLDDINSAVHIAGRLQSIFGDDLFLEVQNHALPEEGRCIDQTLRVGLATNIPVLATNHVHHVTREIKPVQDVMVCLRHEATLDTIGDRLFPNDQRFLRSPADMSHRFRHHPELLRNTLIAAERCSFTMRELKAPLPCFPEIIAGETADNTLKRLTWDGAKTRYPILTDKHVKQIEHELSLVEKLEYAGYFLILWDIVRAARVRKILVQGRGSAANSAVCYCLGITAIDPIGRDLLFERFMSEGRKEPPDIDLDIEHDRREEILQYVYSHYGRNHAAMVAAIHTYQPRAAARDVGRVMGLSAKQQDALASLCDRFFGMEGWGGTHARDTAEIRMSPDRLKDPAALREAGLDPDDKRVALVPWIVDRLVGLPRHRATHTGGFVLSEKPIYEVCPIEWAAMDGRSILQWEKDDIATLGLVKFDLLGLGILSVLRRQLDLIENHRAIKLDLWQLPHDDPAVFDDICAADTVGVFQIESRAQMNTLPRLRPRQFYDLVVEVALIRPGPIQGEMIHPYLRRRRGEEAVTYLHPALEPHLARTLGIPLFQEQGMKVAIEIAGFSPAEADELRRVMSHKRSKVAMAEISKKLIQRMSDRGIDDTIAERIVKQLSAFADYGFPESHAASFALLVYASAYLRHYYMPEFYAAILNAQPMGFYSPSSLVEDAKRHHVEIRPPDVLYSNWDCTLEQITQPDSSETSCLNPHPSAVRIGLRYVRGLGEHARKALEIAICPRPTSLRAFVERVRDVPEGNLDEHRLIAMAHAGAFGSLTPDRRQAVWEILRHAKRPAGPLDIPNQERWPAPLPRQSRTDLVSADFERLGLSPTEHPLKLLRSDLDTRGVVCAAALLQCSRKHVRVAGLVICRQRPATAKGFVFLTLEDEGGTINIIVAPDLFERERSEIVGHAVLEIEGDLSREQGVVNVKARRFFGLTLPWASGFRSHDFH